MSSSFLSTLLTKEEIEFEVEEIKIQLPSGGHVNGKWWGDKSTRPFICLHGWLDNAGSFDRLIPLLPREYSYLAIDFPGHGRSSWNPNGVPYHTFDNLFVLTYLMKEYKWEKLSIIGHSMGANVAFVYASIFPERVDMVVNIDSLKPPNLDFISLSRELEDSLENFRIADQRNQDNSEPPAYSIDEMVERTHVGSFRSVSHEAAPYLLKRSIKPSRKLPGKFYFARDGRLKYSVGFNFSLATYVDLARDIKSPYMAIKAAQVPVIEEMANYETVLSALKESPNFEYHVVDSASHHLHLTEPEKIASLIGAFIRRHKSAHSHL